MAEGWMDDATWNATVEADRARMARRLFGRDGILRDIPGGVVRPDEWTQPNTNPHGFHTYPVWDRQAAVEERADKIMVENPGAYTPEMAVQMAEREVPQYSPSEQRQVKMYNYFLAQGYDKDTARERATMEEEDAWRRRERAAASGRQAAGRPPAGPAPRPRGESRTSGASLPLPADREVDFGDYKGMPPVEAGLDHARVAEVAATMPGIPPEEAWQRAQLSLMRGPGRGGAPAKAAPPPAANPWAGRAVPRGFDAKKVRALASHHTVNRRLSPDAAWEQALVDASRDLREGTGSTHAELFSGVEGGRHSERWAPDSTVPGVNDPTGVPTRVPRELDLGGAADYNYRPPARGDGATNGAYEYSQRDRDMMARGFVPVQTPNGVRYMESAQHEGELAGRPGVPGVRPDLEERGYEKTKAKDVAGKDVLVYQYTPAGASRANRERLADFGGAKGGTPFALNQRIKSLAERAGIPVAQARQIVENHVADANSDDNPANDITMGSQASFQPLRDMADTRAQADQLERVQRVRRNAMLAGGQPTVGPGGTIAWGNALSMMPQDWQNQVLANRLTGGDIVGATPLDVQSNQLRLGNRLIDLQTLSQGLFNPTQQEAVRAAAEQQLTPEAHADAERKRSGGIVPANSAAGQRVLKQINDQVIGTFATDSEIETAVEDAMSMDIPEQEARAYFERRRRDTFFFGSPAGGSPAWSPDASERTGPGGLSVPPVATPYKTGP